MYNCKLLREHEAVVKSFAGHRSVRIGILRKVCQYKVSERLVQSDERRGDAQSGREMRVD